MTLRMNAATELRALGGCGGRVDGDEVEVEEVEEVVVRAGRAT